MRDRILRSNPIGRVPTGGYAMACLLVVLGIGGVTGCGGGSSPPPIDKCVRASDCASPLVCSQGYCVNQCVQSRDCPGDQRCIVVSGQGNVCQAPAKTSCAYNTDCTPLFCGVDLECRNQCLSDIDCPNGQKCTTTSKLCVDPIKDATHYNATTNELLPPGGVDAGGNPVDAATGIAIDAALTGNLDSGSPDISGNGAESGGARLDSTVDTSGINEVGKPLDAGAGDVAPDQSTDVPVVLPPSCNKAGNKALHFSGSTYASIPDTASLHPTDLTVEAWVRFALLPSTSIVIAKPYGAASADSFAIWYQSGSLVAGVALVDDSTPNLRNAWTPDLGRYYHLAFTYEHATGKQKLYIDGSLLVTGTAPGDPIYDAHPVYIGADSNSGSMIGQFVGDIDEVAVWPTARSIDQIQADLLACNPSSFSGMAAYWPLDEGTGQVIGDKSANANNGYLGSIQSADSEDPTWIFSTVAYGGDYTLPAAGVSSTSACAKPRNKALHFGGGQYARISDPETLNLTTFTIEAWVNYTAVPNSYSNGTIFQRQYGTGTADSFILVHQDSGHITCGGALGVVTAAFAPTPGRWYHLACSYDGTSAALKLYIDQDLAGSATATSTLQWDTNPFIVGGATDNGAINSEFRGDIDEVMIWSTVRSIDQVTADLHTCTPASLAGLAAYWSFDEGGGQVAADATTNRNTLQLGSAVTSDGNDPAWVTSTVPF